MSKKILILDDVIPYLNALERALSFDYEIIKAADIETAMKLANNEINLYLVDICLDENKPGIDRTGLEFVKFVKENFSRKPVIVMSAYKDYEGAVEALNLGAFKYLKKPIDLKELKSTIEEGLKSEL